MEYVKKTPEPVERSSPTDYVWGNLNINIVMTVTYNTLTNESIQI